ncbi:hypothetical protein F8388_025657 [Cannabis sativa]|uniref:Core Histone H2A/H2B/H3 domain-containing protein n=1 Tax=Cannabis sativa TaxID=3483 RepID=A0A7J6G1F6_CANSA|nr:hypothetical protein F8388_025657 [Cannabis sativa]
MAPKKKKTVSVKKVVREVETIQVAIEETQNDTVLDSKAFNTTSSTTTTTTSSTVIPIQQEQVLNDTVLNKKQSDADQQPVADPIKDKLHLYYYIVLIFYSAPLKRNHQQQKQNDSVLAKNKRKKNRKQQDQVIKNDTVLKNKRQQKQNDSVLETRSKKKIKKRRKNSNSREEYKRYVFLVLKQVHPGMRISTKAMSVMNSMMNDVFERLAQESAKLVTYNRKMTLSSREIQAAVGLVFPGQLGQHAMAEGAKALASYFSSNTT